MTTMTTARTERLFVAWQDPETRRFHPVALLERMSGKYRFRYLKHAEGLDGFEPFVSFPELHDVYSSTELFPLFENRLMSPRRPDYPRFLDDLGLSIDASRLDVLSRGGSRLTDSIELFAEPVIDRDAGRLTAWFFVRGIRHSAGGPEALAKLAQGEALVLRHERDNAVTDQAIVIDPPDGPSIGWVPDYLVSTIHRLWHMIDPGDMTVVAERVNPPTTPLRARVLCRLQAPCPPNFEAFDDPQFLPIIERT